MHFMQMNIWNYMYVCSICIHCIKQVKPGEKNDVCFMVMLHILEVCFVNGTVLYLCIYTCEVYVFSLINWNKSE